MLKLASQLRFSDVICAGHVIAALTADQLAPARFEPSRAHGTIAQSILPSQLGSSRFVHSGLEPSRLRRRLLRPGSSSQLGQREALHGMFHDG
jgi:hypothetical protein